MLPIDMESRSDEDIARDAVSSIVEVCDQIGRQREAEKKEREAKNPNEEDTFRGVLFRLGMFSLLMEA